MALVTGASKTLIWIIRFLQLCFGIILLGVFAWFTRQIHRDGYSNPRQVSVPLAFSALAVVISFFSIIAVCFLSRSLQWVAAALDVLTFAGYLASAILYRHNYHILGYKNQLRNFLINLREYAGKNSAHIRITNLVRLGAALIIIQVILFFITMLLSILAAKAKDRDTVVDSRGEKRFFGRRRAGATVHSTV